MKVDIENIKRRLLVKYPFFGSITVNLEYVEDENCRDFNGNPTAGTDGDVIYYHPEFINTLTKDEQVFIFAHEVCHVAFNHIYRSEGKDGETWNIATDAVINALLKQDGLPLVTGGIDIHEAINYDAEEMYNKLLEKNNQNKNDSETKKSKDSDDKNNQEHSKNNDIGHDSHSLWKEAIERKKEQEEQKNSEDKKISKSSDETKKVKSNLLDKIFGKNKKQDLKANHKESEQKDIKNNIQEDEKIKQKEEQVKIIADLGEKKTFRQNRIERIKQLEELKKTIILEQHGAGKDSAGAKRKITNIGIAQPLIDWRKLLKEAIKYDVDWSYQNATIEDGVVTAHLEEMPKPEAEIILDTSGSIDENLLKNFLRECKNILVQSKVKVGCFDTKFYGFNEIKNVEDIDNMHFPGGGGTNFDVAVEAFSRKVENKIIFTDGCATMPKKSLDAIWLVFGNTKITPKGGKVIYINEVQLNKLHYSNIKKLSKRIK